MWYVYIVKCSDESSTLYTGITNDISKRINTHNKGLGSKLLRGSKLPVSLYWCEEHIDRSSASKREYEIKQLNRSEKIKLKNPSNI